MFAKFLSKNPDLLLQTALSFAVRIFSAMAAFLMTAYVSRTLGAGEAGYYFLSFSIITVLASLSRVGFDNAILRFTSASAVVGDWGLVKGRLIYALLVSSLISSLVGALLYLGADWLASVIFSKPELAGVLRVFSPAVFGISLLTLAAMGLQGLQRIVWAVIVLNIVVNVAVILVLWVWEGSSALEAGTAFTLGAVFGGVFGCFLLVRFVPDSREMKVQASEMWKTSLPLLVVVVMEQLIRWSGQFIGGVFLNTDQLAQVAVAQRTALLISFVLMAVNLVVAPRFAAMSKLDDQRGLQLLAVNSVRFMVIFATPLLFAMLFAPSHVLAIFGQEFTEVTYLLQILAVGQFVNVATGPVSFLLSMSGHEKDLRNSLLLAGPTALALSLALIPLWGATGSALATAIALAAQNLIAVYWVKKRLGFNLLAVWRS